MTKAMTNQYELMHDAMDLVETAVAVMQELRYGNSEEARLKAIELAAHAADLYMKMQLPLTADVEEYSGESDP